MITSFLRPFRAASAILSLAITTVIACPLLQAQVVIAPAPTVGSQNPVSAEPLVTRPNTTPCVVQLFNNLAFNTYSEMTFNYTPQTSCAGPWAKVVFSADFTVTKGVQFDRSSQIYIGGVTIFRGTTAEPGSTLSPSWHVERDVTDLSAALKTAATGIANIDNIVNSTYTGVIYGNAELDFYPASSAYPAPTVPDMVVPIYQGDPTSYFMPSAPLTDSITLPTNVTSMYLDVTAETDEFWWLSTPNATIAPLVDAEPVTAFREIDVSIDGTPAGIAPQPPYVFTGGIDPYLWIPISQAQTLNFKPYRINLTPFASVVDDGNKHTFVMTDVNTQNYGSGGSHINGNLLVYTDHGSATVTGAVTSNTLTAAPATTVAVTNNLNSNLNGSASVSETLNRSFAITGYVNTSQGKITTTVSDTANWSNSQTVLSSDTDNVINDLLNSTINETVTTATPTATSTVTRYTSNPLKAYLGYNINPDTNAAAETVTLELNDQYQNQGPATSSAQQQEDVISTDTLNFNASGNFTGHNGQASTATFFSSDSSGNNYSSTLTAANGVLAGVSTSSASSAVTVLVSTGAATATQGGAVTLSASVSPRNSSKTPGGFVTFYANSTTALGTAPVTATGASLALTTLPVGADIITATYTGDTNFTATTSFNTATVAVTGAPNTFTFGTFAPASLTLTQGLSGIVTLPLTASAAFNGTVTFTCSGAPSEASCTINPASLALTAGQTANVSVVVATTAPNSTSQAANHTPSLKAFGGVAFASLFLLVLPVRRSRRLRNLSLIALAIAGLGAAGALTGCSEGTSAPSFAGTPKGSYTLTVTGTSGTVTQTTTFKVTVQ